MENVCVTSVRVLGRNPRTVWSAQMPDGTLYSIAAATVEGLRSVLGGDIVKPEWLAQTAEGLERESGNKLDGDALRALLSENRIAYINKQTDIRILSGFRWRGIPVWLSSENQFNFKAAYDLAVQTQGASLPVKFKLGEEEGGKPVYFTFEDMGTFTDFYTSAIAFINAALNDGWKEKDREA